MSKHFSDYFSSHAASYALFRPHYPASAIEAILPFTKERTLAIECGCGNGQLSLLLSSYFDQVIATDASAGQIQHAHLHPQIQYHVASAEALPVEDGKADIVIAAQAAHWFDLDRFYTEVRRVAKPQALIALLSYGSISLAGDVGEIVSHFEHETLASYWPPERRMVGAAYASLPFPFEEIPMAPSSIDAEWSYHQLMGYILTWSSVRALEKAHNDVLLRNFAADLLKAWGDSALRRQVHWPLHVRLGHVS